MLSATAQKLGDRTVLRCQGRIVLGDAYAILRNAVLIQTHIRTLILDLAQVDRIDAGGLGVLLALRELAYSHAIGFQLMNVINQVEHVEDMLQLLHFAAAIAPRSVDQANERLIKDNCKYAVEGQGAPPPTQRNSLLAGTAAREQELAGVLADVQSAQIGARISEEGQLLAGNTTVAAKTLVGTGQVPTDRRFPIDRPRFACVKISGDFPKSVEMTYSHPSYIQARKGA